MIRHNSVVDDADDHASTTDGFPDGLDVQIEAGFRVGLARILKVPLLRIKWVVRYCRVFTPTGNLRIYGKNTTVTFQ